ncbi:MAG: AtpZ/AtpI family protein [Bacteroidales bacterium]|nr:AtpZ/AtpI family protein [Bacteroidales bacterium]
MGEIGKKWNRSANHYLKYSGMAFQMMAVTAVFAVGGVLLDRRVALRVPVFTIVLTIVGVFLAMYSSLREFIKKDKNHEDKDF